MIRSFSKIQGARGKEKNMRPVQTGQIYGEISFTCEFNNYASIYHREGKKQAIPIFLIYERQTQYVLIIGKKLQGERATQNCTRHEVNLALNEQIVVCHRINFIRAPARVSNKILGKDSMLLSPSSLFQTTLSICHT